MYIDTQANLLSERKKKKKEIMALKKVKGNFERMFDKNLTDLVRGIRNNKDNEVIGEGSFVFAQHWGDHHNEGAHRLSGSRASTQSTVVHMLAICSLEWADR